MRDMEETRPSTAIQTHSCCRNHLEDAYSNSNLKTWNKILLQDRRKRVKGRGTSLGRQLVKGVGRRNSKRVVYLGWEAIFNLRLVLNRLPTL